MKNRPAVTFALVIAGGIGTLCGAEPAGVDPFAAYVGGTDRQLSAMLATANDHAPAAPAQPSAKPAQPEDPVAAPTIGSAANDTKYARALARLRPMRQKLEAILNSEGVPKELLAVAVVESGGRANAISPKQARGLWQFMPDTARQYGLAVTASRDERLNLEWATRAAARYLRDLFTEFGNWPLALAGYNAGQDAVRKALDTSRATTFWQLSAKGSLPEETRNYVPAVLSAIRLLRHGAHPAPKPASAGGGHWLYASTAPFR